MNTYMKMSAKEQDHRDFLNSLRERLNVDDQTIANLEKRITGKQLKLRGALSEKLTVPISARGFLADTGCETPSRASGPFFGNFVFSREEVVLGANATLRLLPRALSFQDSLLNFIKLNSRLAALIRKIINFQNGGFLLLSN